MTLSKAWHFQDTRPQDLVQLKKIVAQKIENYAAEGLILACGSLLFLRMVKELGMKNRADVQLCLEAGVAGLEINVSCPNVKAGGMQFGQDPGLLGEVCRKVKIRAGEKPVMVKLTPNVTDITQMARAAEDNGANLLSLINTLQIPVIGLGGITTAEDILEFLLVGARAVQIGSANFQRPDRSFQLVQDLENLVQELGLASWDSFRGQLESS